MVWLTAVIIYLVVISRKEGKDATVSRPEGPLSSEGCGAVAVTATARDARGFALRAGQAHPPERTLRTDPRRHDRAAVRRTASNAERAVRVRKAVLAGGVVHDTVRPVVVMPQRDDGGALPPQVDLHHHVALVARHPPAPRRLRLTARRR